MPVVSDAPIERGMGRAAHDALAQGQTVATLRVGQDVDGVSPARARNAR